MSLQHSLLRAISTLILLLIFSVIAIAESPVSQVVIGASGDDGGADFIQVDGGFVIAGNTTSVGSGGRDALVFMTDSSGTPLWTTVYGGGNHESAIGIVQLPDGGYAISGRTASHSYSDIDLYFARLDAQGGVTNFKSYGGYGEDRSMGMIPTSDGQFLIFGATRNGTISFGTSLQDVMLLKVTEYGDVIWSRAYGGDVSEVSYSVKETPEGDFIVFAYGDSWANQYVSTDMYLLKIDSKGNLLWTVCYGGDGYEMITAASAGYVSPQGDIYVMGATNSYGAGDYDQILMKFDSQGTLQWTRTIGTLGYDYGRGVITTGDDNVLAWGFIANPLNGSRNALVTKFTSDDGVPIWSKSYGGTSDDDIYRIQETSGDSLVMMGLATSFGNGGKDIWLIHTDPEGNTDCHMTDYQPAISDPEVPATTTGAYRGTVHMEIAEVDINTIVVDQTSFMTVDTICTESGSSSYGGGFTLNTYALFPNSPNPFNPETTIQFELAEASLTKLSVFNVKGQWVCDLVMDEDLPAGSYTRHWDGKDHLGKHMPSGVYIYRIQAGDFFEEQEMLLLK